MDMPMQVFTKDEWEKKLNGVKVTREDVNKLVMNFLVTVGYDDVVEKFQQESGTEPEVDIGSISIRMAIKNAIECGDIWDAIEKIDDFNPEILKTNPELSFGMHHQWLIELIRRGQTEEALEFARIKLAPIGEQNQLHLEELERTLTLLVLNDFPARPFRHLLNISRRYKMAREVNAAILASQDLQKDPKLHSLLKMLVLAQTQLAKKAVFPRRPLTCTSPFRGPKVQQM